MVWIHRNRLIRALPLVVLAWGGPALALFLGRWLGLPLGVQIALALTGGLAAVGLAAWFARVRTPAPIGAATIADQPWERVADPEANYANRWASYQHLTEWLKTRDWKGTTVAEFGHTNGVLDACLGDATRVLLEYPEHDIQHLDRVESDRFDLAILDQTLEHVPDPERALGEVRRVLKPEGVAIVTTPFLVPLHGTEHYGDYTRWTPQGLETMLKRCGFDADVRAWGNLPAARELLGSMYLTAAEARERKLRIADGETQAPYPVTVWAIARARK